MNSMAVPIIHPVFRTLKNSSRLLHLMAAGLIMAHALTHFTDPFPSPVFFWCQVIISLDIILLVFYGRQVLQDMPRVNLFFRLIESLFFLGIATLMFLNQKYLFAGINMLIGLSFIYLLYCERRMGTQERIGIYHTGISIPALPENKFFKWSQIAGLKASYDAISIETSYRKIYSYHLQKNLGFAELEQIHEFCRHYLGEPVESTQFP